MRFLLALSALTLVAAQNATNMVVVKVGGAASDPGGVYQFNPSTLNATTGDTITFEFTGAPGNHSITQSTFTDPCDPMPGGFDSGWVFIPESGVNPPPQWNLTITDASKPIWFFCKQLVPLFHCSSGMVGAINAPLSGNNTFAAYQNNAKNFKGQSGQGEGNLVGIGASASTGPGPLTGGASGYTGAPVASTPAGSASPTSTSSTSGAVTLSVNSFLVTLAIALGVVV